MQTYAQRLRAGLHQMGWREDATDRSRYTAFTKPGTNNKLFVGPSGALRQGRSASASHSIGDPTRQTEVYKRVLLRGDPQHIAAVNLALLNAGPAQEMV